MNNSQLQNDLFIIEKSSDGILFKPIIQMEASGTKNNIERYHDIDRNPAEGNNYYRLKILYKDGSFGYSGTRQITFDPNSDFTLFPNPAGEYVNIYWKRFLGKEVDLAIINTLGQVVYQQHFDKVEDAILPIELEREVFKDGIYLVSVIHKGRAQSKRLVFTRF